MGRGQFDAGVNGLKDGTGMYNYVGWQLNSVAVFSENLPSCHVIKRLEQWQGWKVCLRKSDLQCQAFDLYCKICASEIKVNYY